MAPWTPKSTKLINSNVEANEFYFHTFFLPHSSLPQMSSIFSQESYDVVGTLLHCLCFSFNFQNQSRENLISRIVRYLRALFFVIFVISRHKINLILFFYEKEIFLFMLVIFCLRSIIDPSKTIGGPYYTKDPNKLRW